MTFFVIMSVSLQLLLMTELYKFYLNLESILNTDRITKSHDYRETWTTAIAISDLLTIN